MRKQTELASSPNNIRESLLENRSYTINESGQESKFRTRRLSSVCLEDEEILERSASMYQIANEHTVPLSPSGELYPQLKINRGNSGSSHESSRGFINFTEIAATQETKVQMLTLLNLTSYMAEILTISIIIWLRVEGGIFEPERLNSPLVLNNSAK